MASHRTERLPVQDGTFPALADPSSHAPDPNHVASDAETPFDAPHAAATVEEARAVGGRRSRSR